jgi:hypothetical protein
MIGSWQSGGYVFGFADINLEVKQMNIKSSDRG